MKRFHLGLENYRPRLKQGRLIPGDNSLIYEVDHPYDELVLPIQSLSFLSLCDGKRTVREIIETLFRSEGTVGFKCVFETLVSLQSRGFLANGGELSFESLPSESKILCTDQVPFLHLQWPLGQRVFNERVYPQLFYLTTLGILIYTLFLFTGSFFSGWGRQFLRLDGSYASGILFFYLATSALLTMKNMLKGLLLLALTGRVYNSRLVLTLFSVFFKVGSDSVFLVSHRLFLTLFFLSSICSYFVFISMIQWFYPHLGWMQNLWSVGFFLVLLDLNPFFRGSEVNQFFRSVQRDGRVMSICQSLRRQWEQKSKGLTDSVEEAFVAKLLQHYPFFWSLFSLSVWGWIVYLNEPLFVYSFENNPWHENTALSLILVSLFVVASYLCFASVSYLKMRLFDPVFSRIKTRVRQQLLSPAERHPAETLIKQMSSLPLFSYLTQMELVDLLRGSRMEQWDAGSTIIRAGQSGDDLFILLEGALRIEKQMEKGWKNLGLIFPITIFGEMAAIEGIPRQANIVSMASSLVLAIPITPLRQLFVDSPYGSRIQQFSTAIMINQFFSSSPLFRQVEESTKKLIMAHCEVKRPPVGEAIFYQGTLGDGFYILVRGTVKVLIDEVPVGRIDQGGFFGEISMIADVPRTATVVPEEPCLLLYLDKVTFWEVLSRDIRMAMMIESVGEQRMRDDLDFMAGHLAQLVG